MLHMEEFQLYSDVADKLRTLLSKNNLVHTFSGDTYPITLTISQDISMEGQMELYNTAKDGVSSRDAKLKFIFKDGEILIRTDSRLIIPDDLLAKIKNHAKKMHYLYLQAFFRDTMRREAPNVGSPAEDDDGGGEYITEPDDDPDID